MGNISLIFFSLPHFYAGVSYHNQVSQCCPIRFKYPDLAPTDGRVSVDEPANG